MFMVYGEERDDFAPLKGASQRPVERQSRTHPPPSQTAAAHDAMAIKIRQTLSPDPNKATTIRLGGGGDSGQGRRQSARALVTSFDAEIKLNSRVSKTSSCD